MAVTGLRERMGPVVLMGGGLALVGAAGYGFVALAGHTLATTDAAAVASLYLMVNIIGPGLFFALEQETSRATSALRAAGGGIGPVVRRAGLLALVMLVGVLLVLLAISPVLTQRALGGEWGLFAAVLLSVATSAAVYLVRGLLGGTQRFSGYAATLGAEGLARLVPCLAVAASGMPNATWYAVIFAAGSGVGALAGLPWLRGRAAAAADAGTRPGSPLGTGDGDGGASVSAMARGLSLLIGGTLLMQLVANLAPIVVTSRLVDDAATAAAFASAFVLVRIPLFLFAPVQAMLLPALTAAATVGDLPAVRAKLRLMLAAVVAIGVPCAVASFVVGPWVVQVFFGAQVRLSGVVLGLLGASTVALMAAQVLQPGLVALGRHRFVTVAWAAASVALVAILALPGDPLHAAVAAQSVASALVVATMAVSLYRGMRVRAAHDAEPAGVPG